MGQDDFVTVVLQNGIEFFEAAFAVWKLGATPQPVSAKIPKAELEAILDLANPSLVVGVPPRTLEGRNCIPAGFEPDPGLSNKPLPDRTAKYAKAMTSGGSTGRSKLIVAENAGEYNDENPLKELVHWMDERPHLIPGPLHHNGPFGSSMRSVVTGCHVIVMTRSDEQTTLILIEQYHIERLLLVPTMMHRIWRLGEEERSQYDLSSLRVVLRLVAPCPAWLKEAWIEWVGPERIYELYGGTESFGTTWITGREWLEHRGSVGKPMVGTLLKILNSGGRELPRAKSARFFLMPEGGEGSTHHYVGAEPKRFDGFETLGDIGWIDEDDYLYLADRRIGLIIAGGANIYPAEVEAALDAHPKVASSAVIGPPDKDLGQRVHASFRRRDRWTMINSLPISRSVWCATKFPGALSIRTNRSGMTQER